MSHRITTQIEEWTEKALRHHAGSDRVSWDCTFAMTEQGPQMLMAFFLPGAVLGTEVQTFMVLQHVSHATEMDIEATVRNVLEDLRSSRSQQLAEQAPEQPSLFAVSGG